MSNFRSLRNRLPTLVIALTLAACSTEKSPAPESEEPNSAGSTSANDTNSANTASPAPSAPPIPTPATKVLTHAGLGDLRIGEPLSAGSTWAERGAQASETCRTISSPDFPGTYAIVEDGKVRRITAGQKSTVRLAENIGVGSMEKEVHDRFPSFRAEPHAYQAAPAKYLTAPNAASGNPALRFEIGDDGDVTLIHVGTMPVLGYVEGCA